MEIGFSVSGRDNDSYYVEDTDAPACGTCGLVQDPEWLNHEFKLVRKQYDYSYPYDSGPIVSDRFREVTGDWPSIRFDALPSVPGFHRMYCDRIVAVDSVARGTRFERQCGECGRHAAIAGATPVFLPPGVSLEPGLSRSDVVYGSAHIYGSVPMIATRKTEQGPVILVDLLGAETLQSAGLRGLVLHPIKSSPEVGIPE